MPSAPDSSATPPPEAVQHGARVTAHVVDAIAAAGGWISFARYMELALYAPGLGYYSAGSRKLGPGGDFVTAPELTPLFGHCLARQAEQLIRAGLPDILEIGAGSGALAAALLAELERADALPGQYSILELSAELRERERDLLHERVPHLVERVAWLNRLPPTFSGLVLGNEVLDAMPVNVIRVTAQGIEEAGVGVSAGNGALEWRYRPAQGELLEAAGALDLAAPYTTEIGLVQRGFIATIGRMLERGVALFIDYGFPAREYYHPDRSMGTLRCHHRHRAIDDPFHLPGLVDITAHVDFSAVARSAGGVGLETLGYTSQAHLLVNCGITRLLERSTPADAARYLPQANAVQRLVSPAEMGELFKAIALGREFSDPLVGFAEGDRRSAL